MVDGAATGSSKFEHDFHYACSNKHARRPRDEAGVAGALLTVVEAYAAVVLFGSRIQSSPEGEKHRIHWRNYSYG